jgi:hypothetical protein
MRPIRAASPVFHPFFTQSGIVAWGLFGYSGCMQTLPEVQTRQLLLIVAPQRVAAWDTMLEIVTRLACRGPLRVLDGGNQFNAYPLARALRRRSADLDAILARIRLARVFTCYQMETLLLAASPTPEPTIALDFLATFLDESVALAERHRLLAVCARHLRRLSRTAPVVVSARSAGGAEGQQAERAGLLAILREAADEVVEWQPPVRSLCQARLI